MVKLILRILRKLVNILSSVIEKLESTIQTDFHGGYSFYEITAKDQSGIKLKLIKPPTIERIFPLKIFKLIKGGYIDFYCQEQYMIKYKDAMVFPYSDFIISENKVIWDKFYNPVFTKNIPLDKDLIKRVDRTLYINTNKEIVHFQRAFSLCGVYSVVWSHFMIQYLPKLYYSQEIPGLYDNELTILVPEYNDNHLNEILHDFINQHKNLKVFTLSENQAAQCEELIHMESATQMIDHESYVSYSDMIIPEKVAVALKENLVSPFVSKYAISRKSVSHKLFIRRKAASYRNLENYDEIENFFRNEGFLVVEPHLLDFEKKIELFYNAEIITGPYSSGFSNLIFSQPKTKVLVFVNLQRGFEPYLSFFEKYFDTNILAVTGYDENPSDSQSSFYIPLEKIIAAYNYLSRENSIG